MGSEKLSEKVKLAIENESIENYLSIASIWEMSIKYRLGKLDLGMPFEIFVQQEILETNLKLLNINIEHINLIANLSFHHRDPFDRLIIPQAMIEKIRVCTAERIFNSYPIIRYW